MTPWAARLEEDARRDLPRTLAHTVWLQHHLAAFLQVAAKAELPTIVLKGAALAETIYPQLGLRDFRDIDVLIQAMDAAKACSLLEGLGYEADEFHWQELVAGRDGQANFAKRTPAGPVILELHTDLLNNDLFAGRVLYDVECLWVRSRSVTLAGQPTRVLGPEDQILHLCLHLAGHHWHAPRSLRDIAHVCAKEQVDWPHLSVLALEAHMSRIAWLGLHLTGELFGANFPVDAIAALAPPRAELLARLGAWRVRDAVGNRTAFLRAFLFLLSCDPPARLMHLPGDLYARRRRRHHDNPVVATARLPRRCR